MSTITLIEGLDRRAHTGLTSIDAIRAYASMILRIYDQLDDIKKRDAKVAEIVESAASKLCLALMTGRVSMSAIEEILGLHVKYPGILHFTYYWALAITLMKSYVTASAAPAAHLHIVDKIYGSTVYRVDCNDAVNAACIAKVLQLLDHVVANTTIELLRTGAQNQCDRIRSKIAEAARAGLVVRLTGKVYKSQISCMSPNGEKSSVVHSNRVDDTLHRKCAACGKVVKCMMCPCGKVYYCGIKCQKVHWGSHKPNCPVKERR